MTTLKTVLDRKGHRVWSIGPDDSVLDAIRKMADKQIGALLVMDGDALVGIFTERDYARNVFLKGKSSPTTPVRDVMTSPVIHARADETVEDAMTVMTRKRVRHLPVFDDDEMIGMVSIGDLVKTVIEEQKHTIEQLENYIRA